MQILDCRGSRLFNQLRLDLLVLVQLLLQLLQLLQLRAVVEAELVGLAAGFQEILVDGPFFNGHPAAIAPDPPTEPKAKASSRVERCPLPSPPPRRAQAKRQ